MLTEKATFLKCVNDMSGPIIAVLGCGFFLLLRKNYVTAGLIQFWKISLWNIVLGYGNKHRSFKALRKENI
jgi:hypothetical protein